MLTIPELSLTTGSEGPSVKSSDTMPCDEGVDCSAGSLTTVISAVSFSTVYVPRREMNIVSITSMNSVCLDMSLLIFVFSSYSWSVLLCLLCLYHTASI